MSLPDPSHGRRAAFAALIGVGLLAAVYLYYNPTGVEVAAALETTPVPTPGDAADDPAIWVDPRDPSRSVIFGTDKEHGLGLYDLSGEELQFLERYEPNNVDLRVWPIADDRELVVVATSAYKLSRVLLYRFDPETRRLDPEPMLGVETRVEPDGVCMVLDRQTGDLSFVVTGRHREFGRQGWVDQWVLRYESGRLSAEPARFFEVGGTLEACAADDELGRLYVADEDFALWRYDASHTAGTDRVLVDRVGLRGRLRYNCEGIAIYAGRDGDGYVVVSSQGSNDFTVYERAGDGRYVGRFSIGAAAGVDEVTHCDGVEVTSASLGARFPEGLLVVQDDRNPGANQNFKLVSWQAVRDALGL